MKKLIVFLLIISILASSFLTTYATQLKADELEFNVTYIPCDDNFDTNYPNVIKARYKDTKEPIPLSLTYDNRLYATIPNYNINREIEAFDTTTLEFTDDTGANYEFHTMKELSRAGIIKGNDKGEALPFSNITRAEATAMALRFLGLNNTDISDNINVFDDVKSDKWYYKEILLAYTYGLIKGDSKTTFSPEREITREEFTVIAYRIAKMAKLGFPYDDNVNAQDKDKISSWAKEAYYHLGNYIETDIDYTDINNPKRLINSKSFATRYFVANLLYNLELRCQIYPSQLAEHFGFDKKMPIIDGSTSTYPFTEAVYGNLFSNGLLHPDKPKSHSKSHATYQRLINGEIDLSFASVYPASDILALAKEKNVELELIPIAYDAMIFFTNKDNEINGLTSEQISNIYVNNAYKNWNEIGGPDALLYPYCRNNDSGSHAQMEKHFLYGNEINETIRKETTSETMANVLTDVMGAKTIEPLGYGLGYSIYYYFNNMDMFYNTKSELKLLAIDGVYPDDETIANKSYPLSNNTYLVIRKDSKEGSAERKMAEFMLTNTGQDCVEQAGFGRLIPGSDYYKMATNYSKEEVEDFAKDVKEMVLSRSWDKLSDVVSYPITIGDITCKNKEEFAKGEFEKNLTNDFFKAVENEDCSLMWFNFKGIMFSNGEIWLAEVLDSHSSKGQLKVISIGVGK